MGRAYGTPPWLSFAKAIAWNLSAITGANLFRKILEWNRILSVSLAADYHKESHLMMPNVICIKYLSHDFERARILLDRV